MDPLQLRVALAQHDDAIVDAIKCGRHTAEAIRRHEPVRAAQFRSGRRTDGRMQALRKAGRITWTRTDGWRLA